MCEQSGMDPVKRVERGESEKSSRLRTRRKRCVNTLTRDW